MPETDHCPVCGTTCAFEYGSEATCKTCRTRWRRREAPEQKGILVYEKWSCRFPKMNIPFPFVGGGIKVGPRWCRWVKLKEKRIPATSEPKYQKERVVSQKNKIYEETISILPKEYSFYPFELTRKGKVKGVISSSIPVDVLFLDEMNFEKYEDSRNFVSEDIYEGIFDAKVDFEASFKGSYRQLH